MEYIGDTETQPVVGKQAQRLDKALRSGSHVANVQAQATAQRIFERYKKTSKYKRN